MSASAQSSSGTGWARGARMNKQRWNELRKDSRPPSPNWPTWAVIVVDLALLALGIVLATRDSTLAYASLLPFTLFQLHSYLILHEATHGAVSPAPALNNFVGHVCGWLIVMPFLARQSSHALHHSWTAHPTGDPANRRLIERFAVMDPKQAAKLEFVWKYWVPVLALNDRIGLWRAPFAQRRESGMTKRIGKEIRMERLYAAGYVLVAATALWSEPVRDAASMYVPCLLALLFLEELVNLPHHAGTPLLKEDDPPLLFWEQGQVSHACRSIPFWSKYILLNFNLHSAHHLFPWAPWYALPRLSREISGGKPTHDVDHEFSWALANRKRPLLSIMGAYFDKIPKDKRKVLSRY